MCWTIRRAGAADAAALSLVASASFLETFATALSGPDILAHVARYNTAEKFAGFVHDPESIVTIAEYDGTAAPVGYTVLTPPDLPSIPTRPGDVELKRIYTLTMMHGSGLGAALMTQAIADARASGAHRLLLGVFDRNARARAFYERNGFVVAGTRQFKVGNMLCDDFIYRLTL